jgi:hypothetical protein
MAGDIELYSTLLPSMGHFGRFASDPRMRGIRLNTPMLAMDALQQEFELLHGQTVTAEMFFDVKGRQLRTLAAEKHEDHLELVINHPIEAPHDTLVLFKAGGDFALLDAVKDDGLRLVFQGGPQWNVKPGESFHVISDQFVQHGELFNDWEVARIEAAKAAGFTRWLLSYTESQADVDRFLELVGRDAEVWLKIENERGLAYVQNEFVKRDNLTLVAARGDLYVELQKKHEILRALQLIVEHDPDVAGSRILLSVVRGPVPDCADLSELAWLREIGYRRYMLCDEMCLHEDMLAIAVNAFWATMNDYMPSRTATLQPVPTPPVTPRTTTWGKLTNWREKAKNLPLVGR